MIRLSKNQAKIAFSFCTLFTLYFPSAFSQQVDTAWVRRYNGPGNGDDKAVALAVDDSGNVYVTGSSFDSTTGYDFCTIKYLPNGDTEWVRRYNGPANDTDLARAMVLDKSANVYVTGRSGGDILTVKYGPGGNELWVQRFTTILNFMETSISGGYALGLDHFGNLYVTGQEWDEGSLEWYLIKYDSLGNLVWLWRAVPEGGRNTFGLALDTAGNVYITADQQIVKVDQQGNQIWTKNFSGTAYGIAADNNCNVYVTGAAGCGYVTRKFDVDGNLLWSTDLLCSFGGPSVFAVGNSGNVFVTGTVWVPVTQPEFPNWVTVSYDSLGHQRWYRTFHIGESWNGRAIAVNPDGSVYSAGYLLNYGFAIVKYDSAGSQIWLKSPGGVPNALSSDGSGNVYIAGQSSNSGTGNDFVTIKYSPLPQLKGDLNLDGVLSLQDAIFSINCTFLGEPPPAAPAACDINCDGKITAVDVVILLNMVFLFASPPC